MSAGPHIPTLQTDRLILRAPQMGDVQPWIDFVNSRRAEFVGGPDLGVAKGWRGFAHVAGMWMLRGYGSFVFALKSDPDTPLGMTGPWHPLDWPEPELGWTVWSDAAEGQGFAHEAATAARSFAYDTLGWPTAVSYIDSRNTRSIALAERLGCTLDPAAATPKGAPDEVILVYRHPSPQGRDRAPGAPHRPISSNGGAT